MSTLARKARVDLTRRPARTVLTVCTLGLAIASLATLAVPGLMDRVMHAEVRAARLHDVAMTTHDVTLSGTQLDDLAHLPNVAAFEARVVFATRATLGSRQQPATVWGIDLGSQPVDAIRLTGGRLPQPGELLADTADGTAASFPVTTGNVVSIRTSDGGQESLRVSGTVRSLATSPASFASNNAAVFYTTLDTARSLAGIGGMNYLALRLRDDTSAGRAATVAAVHADLQARIGSEPFVDLPDSRSAGDWPGRAQFRQITALFYVITVLAVGCALFLIANTMNTLVAEQAAEIAILKTLGGRRRQIASIFLRTAAFLGAAGAVAGAALGVGIAWLLTRFFAGLIVGVRPGFAVSVPVTAASVAAGPLLATLASLPGLRRALRRPVAETFADQEVAGYGTGRLDRLVAQNRLLSSPARMGVRNALRQKRRSAATVAQVAVATGLAVALFAVARSVTVTVNRVYTTLGYDVEVHANQGAPAFDAHARMIASTTPGVARVEQVMQNRVEYRGHNYGAYGLETSTVYHYQLRTGHWFAAADATAAAPPVVLGLAVARTAHAHVGGTLTLDTAAGPTVVTVTGIDTGQLNNGGVVFFPLAQLQRLSGLSGSSNVLWLNTTTDDHPIVDQAAAAVQDRLEAGGYQVDTQKRYVQQAANRAQNDTELTVFEVMGLLVVAITLIGLVSALTMGVIERTREIGILRCLGAKARHIRRVFSAEGVVLATAGWAIGMPLGWLLFRGLLVFIRHDIGADIGAVFPATGPPVALVATLAITVLVIRAPSGAPFASSPGPLSATSDPDVCVSVKGRLPPVQNNQSRPTGTRSRGGSGRP